MTNITEECFTTILLVARHKAYKKIIVVSGNPTDPSFYPPTLKILWSFYILRPKFGLVCRQTI